MNKERVYEKEVMRRRASTSQPPSKNDNTAPPSFSPVFLAFCTHPYMKTKRGTRGSFSSGFRKRARKRKTRPTAM